MTSEPIRVVFHLDPNPLLVAVLRSAVHFQAVQAGLSSESCTELANASEDVCSDTFAQLAESGAGLDVILDTYPDRIEISIHNHGQTVPAVGLESFAFSEALTGGEGKVNGLELLSKVDRVQFSSENGTARTTLVKYIKSAQ